MRAFQISALIETAVRDERERIIAMNAPEIERINAYIKALEDAARQALEALDGVLDTYGEPVDKLSIAGGTYEALYCRDAITALRAALAEPKENP